MKSRFDFPAISEAVRYELMCAVTNLPVFRCHLLSNLPEDLRRLWPKNAIAIASLRGPVREWLEKEFGHHNPIVFSDDWLNDAPTAEWIELLLIHEVAHFVARDIDESVPSHGFLWGRCYTVLAALMDFDCIEMLEVIEMPLIVSKQEEKTQLRRDRCKDSAEWMRRMMQQQRSLLDWLEQRRKRNMDYAEIRALCR